MPDDSYSRWLETLDAQTDAGETVDPRELHDQELADADVRNEKGPRLAEGEDGAQSGRQPAREPSRPLSEPSRCGCGARETGWKHPGHRYRCPRYAKNPTREAA